MRANQFVSSRVCVPAIVAVMLACALGSAQAAVVFSETGTDAVIDTVAGVAFNTHNFTISEAGIYRATITDLSGEDDFFDAFASLQMQISKVPFSPVAGPISVPACVASFVDFIVAGAGSFAALVKSTSDPLGSGYQVRVTLIPEPAIWLMLATGLGLLGFVRIRRASHNGI